MLFIVLVIFMGGSEIIKKYYIIIFGGNILRVIFDYCYSCYGNENGGVFVLEWVIEE